MSTPVPTTMKAWRVRCYGGPDVLELATIATPLPETHDVLIRVDATTVSSADRRIRAIDFPPGMKTLGRLIFGWSVPRRPVLGTECTGTVVAIGEKVTRFAVGDSVIAFPDVKLGAHAEYLRMPERGMITKRPDTIGIEEAAALCFGGLTAMDYLRRADLKPGEKILVIGASGTVGGALVQLAVHQGAQVTAVTSTANVARVAALGAHEVIDYTRQDIQSLDRAFDIVADSVGAIDFQKSIRLLAANGRYLAINGGLKEMFARKHNTRRCIAGPASSKIDTLNELVRLASAGHFRPLIDSVVPFENLPAAHVRADSGRKVGSAVVSHHVN